MSGHDFPEVAAAGDVGEQLEHITMILERISAQLTTIESIHLPDNGEEIRRLVEEVQALRNDLQRR
jgi:hypothetical protein